MNKAVLFLVFCGGGLLIRGQEGNIGINTSNPKATLDVTGKPTSVSHLDGIIAPRLTGNELRAKSYGIDQTGALIYATAADTSPSGQTINVTKSGYFYFEGTKWVAMNSTVTPTTQPWYKEGTTTAATDNNENAYIMGNVGIGTANPTANLEVKGIIKSTNPDGSSLILANGANRSEIYFADGLGHSGNDYSLRAGTTTSEDTFQILNIITGGAPFTILPNNNIGIGTVTPTTKLDIAGETKIRTINSGTLGTDNILVSDATGIVKSIPANSITEGAKAVEPWYKEGTTTAATNNNDNAYIMGNVGIGTANPTAKLDINGNIKSTNPDGSKVIVANGANRSEIYFADGLGHSGNDYSLRVGTNASEDTFQILNHTSTTSSNPLTILANDNVGIGTISPTTKLDVNGKVSAVEEIIVKPATDSEGGQVKLVTSSNAPSGKDGFLDMLSNSNTSGARLFIGSSGEGIYIADGKYQSLGNVGIGNPNPTTKLDIAGETKIRTINSGTLGTDN
ncbi:hypothetical protein NOM92_02530, partial [Chryseobacterium sp. EO14]|nr:hypothetical protein [Chryseobacterium sp. EO14]